MLASMLASGEWKIEGQDVTIKVAASASMIDMSLSAESRRIAMAAASGALGRPVKVKVLPGGSPQASTPLKTSPNGGRGRAEQEPIVQRMKEKFGAEIRTIIDYKDKR
jgi:hypothetical protein